MECPCCDGWPGCDYAIECEVLRAALNEAEELPVELNEEIDSLRIRICQLERTITGAGLRLPPEEI